MRELWLPIEGYGGAYSISSMGRVMRTAPKNIPWRMADPALSKARPFRPSECKSFINRDGYPQVRIGPSGAQRSARVHRLVATAFLPNALNLPQVNHRNGNKADNRVENLEWVTRSQNLIHATQTGLQRHKTGPANGMSKLSTPQVDAIRKDCRASHLVANDYGVSSSCIRKIRSGISRTRD